MNRTTLLLILFVFILVIAAFLGARIFIEMKEIAERANILEYPGERIDIIVSDRIPLGCFLKPTATESDFNNLDDKCKDLGNGEFVKWEDIKDILKYGIKVDGYCENCESKACLCLDEIARYVPERRNLNFGYYQTYSLKREEFSKISGQPSFFVVKENEAPKLSLYAGVKLTGKKYLVDASGALYRGNTRISNFVSIGNLSCYHGKASDLNTNYGCYRNCRITKEKEECEKECHCYTNLRKYSEKPMELCENYCSVDSENSEVCKEGCRIGKDQYMFKICYEKTGEELSCAKGKDCNGDGIYNDGASNDCPLDSLCSNIDDEKAKYCEKFIEIQNSVFEIGPGNYTIFKIGDIEFLPNYEKYRGLAYAKVNLSFKRLHPGVSCYNPNKIEEYFSCCDELCDYTEEKCNGDTCYNKGLSDGISKCEIRANCSTTSRLSSEDPFVLCKYFCSSRDGFYGKKEDIKKCELGCWFAARGKNVLEYYFGPNEKLDDSFYPGDNNLEVKDGEVVVLDEGVCKGVCKYDNIRIRRGGVITTNIGKKLILEVKALIIEEGGKIDVSGKGDNIVGKGEDGSGDSNLADAGVLGSGGGGGGYGSEGGKGGDDVVGGGAGGTEHGSKEDPQDLGSPGGNGNLAEKGGGWGGLGGGAVIIKAKKIILEGEILANGHDGCDGGNTDCGGIYHNGKYYCDQSSSCHSSVCEWKANVPNSDGSGGGGGGSGGTINIDTEFLLFNGRLEAKGGHGGNDINMDGWDGSGGGGSGGRIKIKYKYAEGNGIIDLSGGEPGCAKEGNLRGATGGESVGTIDLEMEEPFESGYNKFQELNSPENIVTLEEPYIYKTLYENVYSNLICIRDWEEGMDIEEIECE